MLVTVIKQNYNKREDQQCVKMISIKHAKFRILFGETLANLLGSDHMITYTSGVYTSSGVWNYGLATSSLYIYSLLVESTIVGDVHALLLRVLPLEHTKICGDGIHSEFVHTHYLTLQNKICTITTIYHEAGAMVKFLSRKVVVTLHFCPIVKGCDGLSG